MPLWNNAQITAWYRQQPYLVGANFAPSTAINQLEMWQGDTFDPVTIDRELGYAAGLGMNIMRVFLHDLLWEHDRVGFCQRIDQYLAIADRHGIKTMLVLFDDCWNMQFAIGRQPEPIPFTHNSGWIQSPGVRVVNDPGQWTRLERYVIGVLERYRNDPRVLVWDLYNEPGNGVAGDNTVGAEKQGARTLPLLSATFDWARSVAGVSQPLTAGVWNYVDEFASLNDFQLAHSDLITFHTYAPARDLAARIAALKPFGRPIVCTEYMARPNSTFPTCLPVLQQHGVGAISWGVVSGKTQTIFPWGWNADKGMPEPLFHDIFHADGTLLYPEEKAAFTALAGLRR